MTTSDDVRTTATAKEILALGQREKAEVAASAAEVRAHFPTVAGFFSFFGTALKKSGIDVDAIRQQLTTRLDLVNALNRASLEQTLVPGNPFLIAKSFRSIIDHLHAFELSGGQLVWTRLPSDVLEAVAAIREKRLDWKGTLFRVMAGRIDVLHRLSETSTSRAVRTKAVAQAFWFGHEVWKALGRVASLRLVRGSFLTIKTPTEYDKFERESVRRLRPIFKQQFAEQFFLAESSNDELSGWKSILFFLSRLGHQMDEKTAVKYIVSAGLPIVQGGRGRSATASKGAIRAWIAKQTAALTAFDEMAREEAAAPAERARRARRREIDGATVAELAPGVFGSD